MGQLAAEGIKSDFLKGRYLCRHNDGLLNAVFQDQFREQTLIRYDKGRSGLKRRKLSLKQRAEWVVTHRILRRLNSLRTCVLKIKTPSLVMTPHQQIPLTQWKLLMHPLISRNRKRRKRGGEKLMLMTDISYCVRFIFMTTHLHCPKIFPCRMLSMTELSVKMLMLTALKLAR